MWWMREGRKRRGGVVYEPLAEAAQGMAEAVVYDIG